jgi:nitroreductase
MDVWDAIKTKRAVRKFTDAPLPDDVAQRIVDAGRRSQSSKNSQPWAFVAVRDRDTLQKLSTMGDYMGHVAGAAMCVAIVLPTANDRSLWHYFDAGQCASYMQLVAQELGVGSCLGTVYKPDETRALLGLPDDQEVRIVISFGYPQPEEPRPAKPGGRRPMEDVVHWDKW